jgi:hypothetical protein
VLADQLEAYRPHLRLVPYRLLGLVDEADDAVQEGWLLLSGSEALRSTTLTAGSRPWSRGCVWTCGSPTARREAAWDSREPDGVLAGQDAGYLVSKALLADLVRGALLGRTSSATRQLASRVRRRVQGPGTTAEAERDVQRRAVSAFLAASCGADIQALVQLLDPGAVIRADSELAGLDLAVLDS